MRPEKKFIASEYLARLNASPYFIVVDYTGVTVGQFTELRKRLAKAGAEVHVVKNSIFRIAVKEAKIADLTGTLSGQLAVVSGTKDVTAAAKVVKNFQAEFEKPKVRFGYLNNGKLEPKDIVALADLPSIETLRAKLMGLLKTPATTLVQLLNTPGTQLARVLQARVEKGA
jgi:large subunit ribosomal protein L10